jgi:hypothetical protein|eukprot:SAG25_NODE_320_length_9927_cov_18.459402_4_plen_75_part_00
MQVEVRIRIGNSSIIFKDLSSLARRQCLVDSECKKDHPYYYYSTPDSHCRSTYATRANHYIHSANSFRWKSFPV